MTQNGLYRIINVILAFASFTVAFAQTVTTKIEDLKKAELIVPRIGMHPVKSMTHNSGEAIDTLDTEIAHIKVVLYNDNTWRYVKTEDHLMAQDVFNEYWDNTNSNPYKLETKDLPESWGLWLIDSDNQYHCPYQGKVYYRGKFGIRRGRRHNGVDIPLKTGDPIYSTFSGKVRIAKRMGGYGNLVVIRHENGIETFHGHLSEIKVKEGDFVLAGDVIGLGGSTGRSTGPHLHFETRYKGFAFDPQWVIDFETGTLRRRMFVLKKKYFNIGSNWEQDFDDEEKNEEEDKREDAEKAAMKYYTIKSGDTLGKIAARNGTTVNAICRLNGIKPTTTLKIGRKIRIK